MSSCFVFVLDMLHMIFFVHNTDTRACHVTYMKGDRVKTGLPSILPYGSLDRF